MVIQFSDEILDKHIAPEVSSFNRADIPDMSSWEKEAPYWIANFFLNSAFITSFNPPMNAYAYNFLRRAHAAFIEHKLARDATYSFLEAGGQSPTHYCLALFHWETFLGQSWHAYAIFLKAFKGKDKVFDKGDGSLENRLNNLYNQMKHVESKIATCEMLPGATVPVWLTNDGIHSINTSMTYNETADVLQQIATWANVLLNTETVKGELDKVIGKVKD